MCSQWQQQHKQGSLIFCFYWWGSSGAAAGLDEHTVLFIHINTNLKHPYPVVGRAVNQSKGDVGFVLPPFNITVFIFNKQPWDVRFNNKNVSECHNYGKCLILSATELNELSKQQSVVSSCLQALPCDMHVKRFEPQQSSFVSTFLHCWKHILSFRCTWKGVKKNKIKKQKKNTQNQYKHLDLTFCITWIFIQHIGSCSPVLANEDSMKLKLLLSTAFLGKLLKTCQWSQFSHHKFRFLFLVFIHTADYQK